MGQVNYTEKNGIGILSINRPEALNALSRDIVDEIDIWMNTLREKDKLRVLVLHSEKNFAAGADIKAMVECDEKSAKAFAFSATFDKVASLPIPVIAAIEGYALGGGMELALTADIRIAGENAKMGFPEVGLGIFPGAGGTVRLPRLIGSGFAKELIFSGDIITAERALSMGMVNRIAADEAVLDEALRLAERIARRGPVAVKSVKKVIDQGMEENCVGTAILNESEKWAQLFCTFDQKEGMQAFLEKRIPQFKNQ